MSNRYLDEAGRITSKQVDASIKTPEDALRFFKLMGIKNITTKRQKNNGTTVYEVPVNRLIYTGRYATYKYAIYESGYIRDVSESLHSPWYINKKYKTTEVYWSSWHKKYSKYETSKPAFIRNFDDQLVYLANYILKNRYKNNKVYSCDDWNIGQIKENCEFKYSNRPLSTITVPRDRYLKYKEAYSEVHELDNVLISRSHWEDLKFQAEVNKSPDTVEVFINGTRYNL